MCFDFKDQVMKGAPSSGDGLITFVEVYINCKTKNCSDDQTYHQLINEEIYVAITTTELSLNFDDKNDPFKTNSQILHFQKLQDLFQDSSLKQPKSQILSL